MSIETEQKQPKNISSLTEVLSALGKITKTLANITKSQEFIVISLDLYL